MQYECPDIINYDIYSIFLAIRADLLPAGVATLPVAFFEILGLAGDAGAGIAVVFDCICYSNFETALLKFLYLKKSL